MIHQIIKKYAEANLDIKLIRGWKDTDGNILGVFGVSGKKYSLIKLADTGEWYYWFGIGSESVTEQIPAGRGDYLIGKKLEKELLEKFSSIISSEFNFETLSFKGASWAPINESQIKELARLINDSASINNYLSQNGLLYAGDDRIIFGEDITGSDILKWKIPDTSLKQKKQIREVKQEASNNLSPDEEEYWREKFYNTAASQIGVPYYWGGDDPGKGFDCSGLVHWSLDKSGLIPGAPDDVAAGQMKLGRPISVGELKKGDLVGFKTSAGVPHIGIYTGEGTSYLSASGGGRNTRGDNPKAKVQIGDYNRYGAPAFFTSIDPLIEKRMSSKNIA